MEIPKVPIPKIKQIAEFNASAIQSPYLQNPRLSMSFKSPQRSSSSFSTFPSTRSTPASSIATPQPSPNQPNKQPQTNSEQKRSKSIIIQEQQARINEAFNKISDLNDKTQINDAVRLLDTKESRVQLIDRILKRKQEKSNADEILQMSKVQPLLNRFIRKLQTRKQQLLDLQTESIIQTPSSAFGIKSKDQLQTFSSIQSQAQSLQHQQSKQGSILESTAASSPIPTQRDNNNYVFTVSELENKAKMLSIFLNNNKKSKPSMGDVGSLFVRGGGDSPSGSNMQALAKLNLNKISENSHNMIQRGKEKQRERANELLGEFQRATLAAHFNCYKLTNRFQTSTRERLKGDEIRNSVNTFETTSSIEQMRKEYLKTKNFQNFKNSMYAVSVVEKEISDFVSKQENHSSSAAYFQVHPRTISNPQSRSIENRIINGRRLASPQSERLTSPAVTSTSQGFEGEIEIDEYNQSKKRQKSTGGTVSSTTPSTSSSLHRQPILRKGGEHNQINFNERITDIRKQRNVLMTGSGDLSASSISETQQQMNSFRETKQSQNTESWVATTTLTSRNERKAGTDKQIKLKRSSFHLSLAGNSMQVSPNRIITTSQTSKSINNTKQNIDASNKVSPVSSRVFQFPSQQHNDISMQQLNASSRPIGNFSVTSSSIRSLMEKAYANQRDRTGVCRKPLFEYEQDPEQIIQEGLLGLDEKRNLDEEDVIINSDFMRTFSNNKLLNHKTKAIKTSNKWKLDRKKSFSNSTRRIPSTETIPDAASNDDSLISFTEVTLNKLYSQTNKVKKSQRLLEEAERKNYVATGKRGNSELFQSASLKNLQDLQQIKSEIIEKTQLKLSSRFPQE